MSYVSFSEREGDWGSHRMFMPGMVKKDTDRQKEKRHAGHATQNRTGIVIPGMKMNEMSRKKRAIE